MARNREDEQTVCRLYEIGKIRNENDEEEEDEEGKSKQILTPCTGWLKKALSFL
jgi:hypothetical protein